jgi:hypothetical protein
MPSRHVSWKEFYERHEPSYFDDLEFLGSVLAHPNVEPLVFDMLRLPLEPDAAKVRSQVLAFRTAVQNVVDDCLRKDYDDYLNGECYD